MGATIDAADRDGAISEYLKGFARVHPDCWKDSPLNIFQAMHPCNLHGVWLGTWVNMVTAIPKLAEWAGHELKEMFDDSPPSLLATFKALQPSFLPSHRSMEEFLTSKIPSLLCRGGNYLQFQRQALIYPK